MDRNEAISREEAVRTISRISGGSVSYAEDLYDSFFPKPVVPQYVADWIEKCKGKKSFRGALMTTTANGKIDDWLDQGEDGSFSNQETFARAWLLGYTIEKEKRYSVKLRGVAPGFEFLTFKFGHVWVFSNEEEDEEFRLYHTKKELEIAGFGGVFNSPLFEVLEVDDGND